MYFKRLNYKYTVYMDDLVTESQPAETESIGSAKISKTDQIDLIAVRSYGAGREGYFKKIAYKNADVLLAWNLDNSNIDSLQIPNQLDYNA